MRTGQVGAVRELAGRVQAKVCLGADVKHGYAIITIETNSPEVQAAMKNLKDVIRKEAHQFVGNVLDGQREDTRGGNLHAAR